MRLLIRLGAALALVVGLSSVHGPAHASHHIGLSWDGQQWSGVLTGELFDGSRVWVPGDSVTKSIYVRNQGPSAGRLDVALLTLDGDELMLHDEIDIEVRGILPTPGAGQGWTRIHQDGNRRQIIVPANLGNLPLEVQIRASFRSDAGNRSQARSLDFRIVVAIEGRLDGLNGGGGWLDPIGHPIVIEPPAGPDGSMQPGSSGSADSAVTGSSGVLPRTGAELGAWTAFIAAASIGMGIALLRRRRTGESSDA